MSTRHLATAAVGLTLLLGACGSGSSGSKASTATSRADSNPAAATTVSTVAASPAGVRTDDLEADLQSVDHELDGAQTDVNQANDPSPERADD
jgi:hypothetical protein